MCTRGLHRLASPVQQPTFADRYQHEQHQISPFLEAKQNLP